MNRISRCVLAATVSLVGSASMIVAQETPTPSSNVQTFGDWQVACNQVPQTDAEGQQTGTVEICELKTVVSVQTEGGGLQPVLQIALGKYQGQTDYTFLTQVPTDVLLREPVILDLDPPEDDAAEQPEPLASGTYIRCIAEGCVADSTLTNADIEAMKSAEKARVSFVNFQQTRIGLLVSLNGFSDAMTVLSSR